MVELKIDPALLARLRNYCATVSGDPERSNHWVHFAALNRLAFNADGTAVFVAAGAGFDSDYELNFRKRSAKESAGALMRKLTARDAGVAYRRAFDAIWTGSERVTLREAEVILGAPMTAHKVLACHYLNLLLPRLHVHDAPMYLEIGPGSGYLAALIVAQLRASAVLIDLPEMMPYSMLLLHRHFPNTPVVLPNEARPSSFSKAGRALVFLTPDQLELVPDACVDLAVNTASFGEMLPEEIARYFDFLRRTSADSGLFFTANRVEKWMNRPGVALDANRPGSAIAVRFHEFPWSTHDENLFSQISEFHARVQPDSPVFMRLCKLARHR